MKKVLYVVDHLNQGGIQSFIMNVYRNIDHSVIQIDFLIQRKNKVPFYVAEIEEKGGHIYYVTPKNVNYLKYRKEIRAFFRGNFYDAIHVHDSSLSCIFPLVAAKKTGIPVRIIHSHSSSILIAGRKCRQAVHTILHIINRLRIKKYATKYIACSDKASIWMFGKNHLSNTIILENGIDISLYKYNETYRNKIRDELGIDPSVKVIGHVGRFSKVKNHEFILEVFNSYLHTNSQSVLLLIGDGETVDSTKQKAKLLNIEDKVIFYGVTSEVHHLLQAVDCFLFPSLYEGFPVAVIEAEAMGIPCIVSNNITASVVVNSNVKMIDLSFDADYWAHQIDEVSHLKLAVNTGIRAYDIKEVVKKLLTLYE